ncbi:MAG TPA: ABC transporter ATP-binding protein [Acidimicrobiia bacterium]|jgi:ATP-binding cassette subfamily B protein|nr:ABC transporter ATP-binding protein [Acidimicrobiia bacterium]
MPADRISGSHRAMRSLVADRNAANQKLKSGTLRRIAGYARPYRWLITVFLALVVIDGLIGAAPPLIYRAIIDQGIAEGRSALVIGLAAALAGIAFISLTLGLFQRWLSSRIGEGLVYDLRTQVFDHVQRMPVGFFSRTQTGALVSRLNSDVAGAQQAFTSTLSNVVGNVVTVSATLTAMFVLSWQVTLIALVLLPVFLIPARIVGKKLAAMTRERYELNAAVGQTMTDRFNVAGALLVKLFGRPEEESEVFADRAGRVRDIGIKSAMYYRVLWSTLGMVAAFATAFVYGWGGLMVIGGSLGIGTLVALGSYLNRLYGPLTALSNVQVDVMTTLVSFERVLEVIDLTPSITDSEKAVPVPDGPVGVEFEDVGFAYPAPSEISLASLEAVKKLSDEPGQPVLTDFSFRVEPGQMLAFVGPSGAGKSTAASLISRLYDVTDGSVRVGGTDVRDLTLESLRGAVGVVSQDAYLFHDTLRANLVYARPSATEDEMVAALKAARIWDLVEELPEGLETVVGDHGYRLSGGEKQRLAIARLLLKDPRIVILDEATAHLDSESEAAVQRALASALEGRTSVVIAHRLATVRQADQILVVDEGRVVERGTHMELLRKGGLYAELVRTQLLDDDRQKAS